MSRESIYRPLLRALWGEIADGAGASDRAAATSQPKFVRTMDMKKIAFALVAVSALGLAACGGNKATNTANSTGAATNEAIADVNAAETSALNATNSALDANANTLATEGN